MKGAFIVAVVAALCAPSAMCATSDPAAEKASFNDKVVSSTVKLMAKTYVMTTDLEKLKRKHTAQIKSMDDETFSVMYANSLGVIYESPRMKEKFNVPEDMDREEAVKFIQGLDKNKLCGMIDAVPDSVIAARFRRFMARRMDAMKGMDLTKRVQYAWNSLVGRIEK